MIVIKALALTFLAVAVACAGPAVGGYSVFDAVLHDESRRRDVPYRLYAPSPLSGPYPVVIVSHGVGGARDSMPYLGRALAEHGYVALHMQHAGSDAAVWQGAKSLPEVYDALRRAMWDVRAAQERFRDAPFVINELTKMNAAGPLAGHLDLSRIGMAGHSYGSVTTMVAAGQRMGPNGLWFFKEPRIKAGLVLSPSVPIQGGNLAELYRGIDIPLFHITGTKDGAALPNVPQFDPVERTKPYQTLAIPNQYLLVLDGAEHNSFSGLEHGPHARGKEVDTRITRVVAKGAALFFDAYLKNDNAAEAKLRNDFKSGLEAGDRFEWK